MAGDAPGKRELREEAFHALFVLGNVRIHLAIRALQVDVGDDGRAAVPRTDDKHHVQVLLLDDPIQMHVDEIQARRRPPVAEQARLDVLGLKRLPEQRVVKQINLPDRQVIRGPPVGVHPAEQLGRQGILHEHPLKGRPRFTGPSALSRLV